MKEQVMIYAISEKASYNATLLLNEDDSFFYWNNEKFKKLNIGDYVLVVNKTNEYVLLSKLEKVKIKTSIDKKNSKTSFNDKNQNFIVSGKYDDFVRLKILGKYELPENWQWKSLGSSETTYLNGDRINSKASINTINNRIKNITQLKELSNDKIYREILEASLKNFNVKKVPEKIEKTQPIKMENDKLAISQINFNISNFYQDCTNANLQYSNQLVTRYISSLVTKPFVLLSGLSGSGKTKLAQAFAQWICEDESQYCIVPVGADWTNREPLLGYVNALDNTEYILPENGALQLLINANNHQDKPYFLILDEMNLSHVERYFADFLSVMESKDKFKLHSDKENEKSGVPHELSWPKNLFIVGTVNIDETTYMFSPKVLDRANAIEFRVNETEIEDFLNAGKEITSITKMGASMGNSFVTIAGNNNHGDNFGKLNTELLDFFKELQKLGAEFGYRTASEIQTLFSKIDLVNDTYLDKENEKIDIAIMQKLLPKLHGSRRKLLKTLGLLAQKCLEKEQETIFNERGVYTIAEGNIIKYNLSFEKIARMYKNAIENGFASYAEA
jgi:energy-coupling factor transporter ATP-binding protein EcfA2